MSLLAVGKFPAAATAQDRDSRTPLHWLMRSQRPRAQQMRLIRSYLEHAPAAADIADEQGKRPPEELFSLPKLSARDFVPFIVGTPNVAPVGFNPCAHANLSRVARSLPSLAPCDT